MNAVKVSSAAELLDALAVADDIEIDGLVTGMPMISLRPGVTLRGGTLRFGAKGLRLSSDNRLEDVTILVPDHEVAIGNDTAVSDLGRLTLRNVRTRGQVLLLADHVVERRGRAAARLHPRRSLRARARSDHSGRVCAPARRRVSRGDE
jgi:hypothetical protein